MKKNDFKKHFLIAYEVISYFFILFILCFSLYRILGFFGILQSTFLNRFFGFLPF